MRQLVSPTVAIVLLLMAGCDEKASGEDSQSEALGAAHITDVVPTVDGGAYLVSGEGNIWYARQGEAVRVQEMSPGTKLSSAPITASRAEALWVLNQNDARQVREFRRRQRDDYAEAQALENER